MVGVGFDARVLAALDQRLKSRVGKMAYAGPLLGAMIRPADTLSVIVDGRTARRQLGRHRQCAPLWRALRAGAAHRHPERGLQAILFKSRAAPS